MNVLLNQLKSFQEIVFNDVYERDSKGNTPLHLVMRNESIQEDVVKQLLDKGAPVNAKNNSGQSPLQYALKYKNCELSIVRSLVEGGADVLLVDHWGLTPLFYAVANRDCPLDVIEFLIEKGGDIHVMDKSESTILHHALQHQYTSLNLIRLLINKGVDIYATNIYGETALHIAVAFIRKDVVKLLLTKPKIKVNLSDKNHYTPLHRAICTANSDPGIVKLLLEAGANVQKKAKFEQQSLHLAAYYGNPLIIKLLLEYGARVNVLDKRGHSPLYIATHSGTNYNRAAVKLLLDGGALIFGDHPMRKFYPRDSCPFDHYSPLHVAIGVYGKDPCEENLQRVQLLMKYVLLERPWLCICANNFHAKKEILDLLNDFRCTYLHELHLVCIKPHTTLAHFILQMRLREDDESQTDQILEILATDAYPSYKEVIMGLLSRQELKNGLQQHLVYVESNHEEPSKRVTLDYDSLCSVMKYLIDEDLLHLLLAFSDIKVNVPRPIHFSTPNKNLVHDIDLEAERFFKRARHF